MFELTLAHGHGVDLQSHPSPETLYVLNGPVSFFRVVNGEQETVTVHNGT